MAKKTTAKKATPAKQPARKKPIAKRKTAANTKRTKRKVETLTSIKKRLRQAIGRVQLSVTDQHAVADATDQHAVAERTSPHDMTGSEPSQWHFDKIDFAAALPSNELRYHLETLEVVVALGHLRNAIVGFEPKGEIANAARSLGFHLARLDASPSTARIGLFPEVPVPCAGRLHSSYHEAVREIGRAALTKLRSLAGLNSQDEFRSLNQLRQSDAFFQQVFAQCDAIKRNWRFVDWNADELHQYIMFGMDGFRARQRGTSSQYLDLNCHDDNHTVCRNGQQFENVSPIELPAKSCWPVFKRVLAKKGEPSSQREREHWPKEVVPLVVEK